jgi:hypothetical protein
MQSRSGSILEKKLDDFDSIARRWKEQNATARTSEKAHESDDLALAA